MSENNPSGGVGGSNARPTGGTGTAAKTGSFAKFLSGKLLNLFLWWVFCGMAGTGLLLAWRLPSGSKGGRGLSLLGWGRHDWGEIHEWLGYLFGVLIVLHLLVHWRWLWQFASRKRAWPMWLGLGSGLILAAAFLVWPLEHRGGRGQENGHDKRGENVHEESRHEQEGNSGHSEAANPLNQPSVKWGA